MESLTSGTLAGTGTFRCEICGHVITMTTADLLPSCPGCDGASFTRASLFGGTARFRRAEPDAVTETGDAQIDAAHVAITEPGRYLVFQDTGQVRTVAMSANSMRIGRSLSADLRFEDPTVSRRHAVFVTETDGVRVLDDRSLNGVFVNGERVVSKTLSDGDEIVIGRYRLRFADRTAEVAAAGAELQAE
ncbi:MAG TPA: FHA domain-containing protein [Solirubrobacteraceae bacterium]|nr:FHA domain-containing protein [Solirubrobacteraceae bacterium]